MTIWYRRRQRLVTIEAVNTWAVVAEKVEIRTDYGELYWHEDAEEVEENLEGRPLMGAEETPCAGGEDKSVPGSNSEGADIEVFVGGEMRG